MSIIGERMSVGSAFVVLPALLTTVLMLSGCGKPAWESASTADGETEAPEINTVIEAPAPLDIETELFNNHNISRDHYLVDTGFVTEGMLLPGDGLDMSDPGMPKRRTGRKPLELTMPKRMAANQENYTLTESFRLVDATSAKTEAKILSAYFQGSYGFVSGAAALDQAHEERSSSRSIYAVLESKGTVVDIDPYLGDSGLAWNPAARPVFEGTAVDDRIFRRQFLLDYGSHYVSAITYGYRVAIRGKITQKDSRSDQKIKAAFKATFLSGSAEGGISAENKQTLSSGNVELTFEATSGGLYQDGEQRPGILTNLDDILKMLEAMKQGAIKIHGAPLTATARTYWNLLPPEYERSRRLLEDRGTSPLPESFYGVPRGTVVPWSPPAAAFREDNSGNRRLVVPQGWALCNGEDGTPDLRDRFIMGTNEPDQVGKTAGAKTHAHKASSSKTGNTETRLGGVGKGYQQPVEKHTHPVAIADASSLPPFVKLVYLMRR